MREMQTPPMPVICFVITISSPVSDKATGPKQAIEIRHKVKVKLTSTISVSARYCIPQSCVRLIAGGGYIGWSPRHVTRHVPPVWNI